MFDNAIQLDRYDPLYYYQKGNQYFIELGESLHYL